MDFPGAHMQVNLEVVKRKSDGGRHYSCIIVHIQTEA